MLRPMEWQRRAKIVCTLGPATFSEKAIAKLIELGMDVARLNFSHGNYKTYDRVIRTIRSQSKRLKKGVTILQDLQGPKIRTGKLYQEEVLLKNGKKISVTTNEVVGREELISIAYRPLPHLLKRGNLILIDDGMMQWGLP